MADDNPKYNIEDMYKASQYLIAEQCHPGYLNGTYNPELLPVD